MDPKMSIGEQINEVFNADFIFTPKKKDTKEKTKKQTGNKARKKTAAT